MAFNEAFKQQGLPHEWSEEKYGELLKIGGGKERMHAYFSECASEEPYKSISEPEDQTKFLKDLHLTKTRIFQRMVQSGKMPLRPGVKELVGAPPHFLFHTPPSSQRWCVSATQHVFWDMPHAYLVQLAAGFVAPKHQA